MQRIIETDCSYHDLCQLTFCPCCSPGSNVSYSVLALEVSFIPSFSGHIIVPIFHAIADYICLKRSLQSSTDFIYEFSNNSLLRKSMIKKRKDFGFFYELHLLTLTSKKCYLLYRIFQDHQKKDLCLF